MPSHSLPLWRLVVASLTLTSLASAQDQIPLVCHDSGVQIIALAGSNVPNGTYGLGSSFVNNIVNRIGNSDTISLNYNRFHAAADVAKYFASEVNQGVGALASALKNYTTACPNTPIVIHGYSEGGCVVTNSLFGGSSPWQYPAVSTLTPYAKNIIAVILYGEETWSAGQAWNTGGCTSNAPHLARSNSANAGAFASKLQSFCFQDDGDCCSTANTSNPNAPNQQPWHYNYPNYFDDIAANFIVSQWDTWRNSTVTTAIIPAGVKLLGCYYDSWTRTMPVPMWASSNTTAATCVLACRAAGYQYSGVEYGNECWCGVSQPSNSLIIDGCWTACAGDPIQSCGAGWRLDVYYDSLAVPLSAKLPTGVVALGCYADGDTRTLPVSLYSNSSNSNTLCATACSAAGYIYSGTEYGTQCFCGNIQPASTLIATNSSCNMVCPGSAYQTCGAGWRLSIQQDTTMQAVTSPLPTGIVALGCYADWWTRTLPYYAYTNSSNDNNMCALWCRNLNYIYSGTENSECYCSSTAPLSSLIAVNSTCNAFCPGNPNQICGAGWRLSVQQDTTVSTVKVAALPAGIINMGCYVDGNSRTLQVGLWSTSDNTLNSCSLGCRAAGYLYSGSEYGTECWCGNLAPVASQLASDNTTCNTACPGVGNQVCGGGWRLTITQDTTPTVAVITTVTAGFVPMGCFVDGWARVLPIGLYYNNSNSNTLCTAACRQAGYQYAGTENTECHCGSSLPTTSTDAAECRNSCPGDATQACGGGWRLNIYKDNNFKLFTNSTSSTRRSLTKGRYVLKPRDYSY